MKFKLILTTILQLMLTIQINANDTQTIKFQTFGISIEKPNSWFEISAESYTDNLNKVKTKDEEFNALLRKHSKVPFFAIYKFKDPYDNINPSLKINISPAGSMDSAKPDLFLKSIIRTMESKFANFRIISKPELDSINGKKCAFAKYSYSLAVEGAISYKITSALWILPHKNQIFIIGVGYRSDEANAKFAEFRKIVSSIKLF
jgi:hypothetical protein